jgi:hypothetical protein
LFTALTSDRGQRYGCPKEKLVNRSLGGVDRRDTDVRVAANRPCAATTIGARGMARRTEAATAVEIAPEVTPKFDVISNLKLLDDVKVAVGIQEGA